MSDTFFLNVKKLKGDGIVGKAARHNRRAIQAEMGADLDIDSSRSHLNETLCGPATAAEVAKLASKMMRDAKVNRLRKDAVLAIEIVFSLPIESDIDHQHYFSECVDWCSANFGGRNNILSADIHRDQGSPHCHVLIIPLIAGRMIGSELLGHRKKIGRLKADFHENVASRFGLQAPKPRLYGTRLEAAGQQVLSRLRADADPALASAVWPQIRSSIASDPRPFMEELGITEPQSKTRTRTMTQIFTSQGKGRDEAVNHIGFQRPEKAQTLTCVGLASEPEQSKPPDDPTAPDEPSCASPVESPEAEADSVTREREEEFPAGLYDAETGEFRARPTLGRRGR